MSERDQENEEGGGGRPGLPIDPLRVWNALRRRWQFIAVAGVIGAFVGAAVAKKLMGQTFAAHAVISYEGGGMSDSPERQAAIESVTLNTVLDAVAKKLKLGMPAGSLKNFVIVIAAPRSNIVSVDATWPSADGAAQLANTVIDTFLELRDKEMRERLDAEVERLRAGVAQAQVKHQQAAEAYDKFRREKGITDISQERELAITAAADLAVQADTAKAQAAAAQGRLEELRASASTEPMTPAQSQAEKEQADRDEARLVAARRELDVAKIQFSEDHPTVRRLTAEVGALEQRVKGRYGDKGGGSSARRYAMAQQQATAAAARQRSAEEYRARLRERLNSLSAAEGQAAVLLGELRVADEALGRAKEMLTGSELQASRPPRDFRVLERATPPEYALSSPRKRAALGFPIGFIVAATLGVLLYTFRRADVCTPKEAAFWGNLPVIGASTWPRDPEMLSSLMHDLDDYAPHCQGVTLIVGVSLEEAHLARKVAEWDGGARIPKRTDSERLLASGDARYPLTVPGTRLPPEIDEVVSEGAPVGNMQILTLAGPVPAQALRRAARLADRVLVVVLSGKHSIFQLIKIRARLGRDSGIGVLLVGLDKDYAMVRDRVGAIESFWHATRAAGGRAEA